MSVYAVAQGRVEDRVMLDRFVSNVIPAITAAGGRILGSQESAEVIEGEIENPLTVILEFLRERRSAPGTTRA